MTLQCLPLYTLLLALGNPTVHYLSLDIEGAEFPVLTSIPWNKVNSNKIRKKNLKITANKYVLTLMSIEIFSRLI